MPTDIWYGADCETRIGRRADAETAPTTWQAIDFMSLTVTPQQEWRERAKLGNPAARQNALDPIKPRKGFFRETAELTIDADSRFLPLWLRAGMGAPATVTASALYAHTWASGGKAQTYFDLAVKVGEDDIRVYEGLTLAQISASLTGENTQDFDINLSLRGLRRTRLSDWPAGTVTGAPAEAPMLRCLFEVDDVAADHFLSGQWSYDRQLQEGIYLSATPTVSDLTPNGGQHTGSATFRAIGAAFDVMEEEDTPFEAAFAYAGVVAGHKIRVEHPQALLAPSPLPVQGVGQIERSLNWSPYQTSSSPAFRIVVTNNIASYA
ncbi:MAG: hypothetical protein K2X61_03860 [Caulobacteraceae bacterium]|nr:hypothetical protein [Caulobacteraceae bacterium]